MRRLLSLAKPGVALLVTLWAVAPAAAQLGAATSGDTTVTTGGVAQLLFGGQTPVNGWAVYNPNVTDDLWCSDSTTAAVNGLGSVRIVATNGGYESPPFYKPTGPVSCIGPTTGDKITARRW